MAAVETSVVPVTRNQELGVQFLGRLCSPMPCACGKTAGLKLVKVKARTNSQMLREDK
jgi:hypothetical protein